jgi:hypothetical protein
LHIEQYQIFDHQPLRPVLWQIVTPVESAWDSTTPEAIPIIAIKQNMVLNQLGLKLL